MITITAANAAINAAQEFDKRQLILDAVPGTPLAQLNECLSFNTIDIAGALTYEPDASSLSQRSNVWNNSSLDKPAIHTETLSALATDISKYVQSHLNFAKNTVRPLIEELVTEVKADIESLPLESQYTSEIVIFDLPEPMVNSAFEDAIMDYKDIEYYSVSDYLSLPAQTATEVIAKIVTANSALDKAISTWAAKMGESFFQNIWDCVFTNAPTDQKFDSLINDTVQGIDAAVAIYLLTTKLYDNPPEGVTISLAIYNKKVAALRDQSALRIVHAYEEYIRFKTTGLLIQSIQNTKIVVVGDTYRKWIEEGGNNAVLFGSALSAKPEKFVVDINNKKAEFLAVWERQNWMLTVAQKNKRFVHYKEILKNKTLNLVLTNYKECYAHLRENGVTDPNMPEFIQFQKNLDDFLITVSENDFKNLWCLAQCVVCKCIFYYTDAGSILSGIEEACCDNKDINIREAALISTIAYVVNYICDQMKLSST